MLEKIKFSHSKLNCILNNPWLYNIRYNLEITPKITPSALSIGSAVHWGIEHNKCDLTEYYEEVKDETNKLKVEDEQILAEEMVKSYLERKDEIFQEILGNLELKKESHEVKITSKLKSKIFTNHDFIGIIDLLLLTNEGFIIIDYKTSSSKPNWDKYLDQIYRYIFLLKEEYPNIPVVKIGIINLIKTKISRKFGEAAKGFRKRISIEYKLEKELISSHIYDTRLLNENEINQYIDELSIECDRATQIVNTSKENNNWYLNYQDLNMYGGSPYLPLFEKGINSCFLYNIKDKYYYFDEDKIVNKREMRNIDYISINNNKALQFCRYDKFIKLLESIYENPLDLLEEDNWTKKFKSLDFEIDEELLENYLTIYALEKLKK